MTPEEREQISLKTFLGPAGEKVAGLELRPLSMGSFCLMREAKSEFIAPRGPNGEMENEMLAVLEYVYLHNAPLEEIECLILDISKLRTNAVKYGMALSIKDISGLADMVRRSLKEVEASAFEVREKGQSKDPHEPPNS